MLVCSFMIRGWDGQVVDVGGILEDAGVGGDLCSFSFVRVWGCQGCGLCIVLLLRLSAEGELGS